MSSSSLPFLLPFFLPCISSMLRSVLVKKTLTFNLFKGDPKRPKVTASTRPTLTGTLSKPWVGMRDPHSRFAYWITYGVVLLGAFAFAFFAFCALCAVRSWELTITHTGIAAGAARAYLGWTGVLILQVGVFVFFFFFLAFWLCFPSVNGGSASPT
jgi:hypothetical protein